MTRKQLKQILVDSRTKKKLTHEEVAISASIEGKHITRQYYGMIENGDRTPSVDVAKAIAKVLGIEWTIFFDVPSNQTLRNEREV